MITVFVTGVGGGVGQGIVKSLKLINDLDIRIITADMSAMAPALYVAEKAYLIPQASDPRYVDYLVDVFKRENVDYYIPGTDVELLVCAARKRDIAQRSGTKVIISPLDAVEIADDKYRTYEFLKKSGLAAPASYLPREFDANQLRFPVIVKPRVGYRSIGVSIAHDPQELKTALQLNPNTMVQELIATEEDEYTCTVVVMQGQASEVVVLKRVLRAGDTYRATPVKSREIAEYVRRAALSLGVEGPCNFQLRMDANQPKIFEINCRFSGTTPFCAQLGFNPVEYYMKHDMNIPYRVDMRYDVTILRYWSEVMVRNEDIAILDKNRNIEARSITKSKL